MILQRRILAFAGLYQMAALSKQLSWRGQCRGSEWGDMLHIVLAPKQSLSAPLYRGIAGLSWGLEVLLADFSRHRGDEELRRYRMSVLLAAWRLTFYPSLQRLLWQRLAALAAADSGLGQDDTVQALSALGAQLRAQLVPHFFFLGDPLVLDQDANRQRIGSCWLAGLRMALLWRQHGGRWWQLWGQRSLYQKMALLCLRRQRLAAAIRQRA